MKLTKSKVNTHYELFKKNANNYISKKNFELAVKYIELCARLGYNYNLRYCDDELEDLIVRINSLFNLPVSNSQCRINTIVFYDSFSLDNRGLTQQYLRAIMNWNYELLYITSRPKIDIDILTELNKYPKTKIVIINENLSFQNRIKEISAIIINYNPKYAFLHFTPWDIFGICLWCSFRNIERFLINLTDHAFWLGKCCADYYLEFRKYGMYLSLYHRMIPNEKLLMQPFYPIQSQNLFNGLPKKKNSEIFVFSGSNYSKIYGKGGLFLELVRKILDTHKNVIFLFAGNGNEVPIKNFIKKNKLEKRFILLGPRKDIDQVIKHIDIFVNTFPMFGGLMTQLAAINNKPIIGYTNMELYDFNNVEDFLGTKQKSVLLRTSINDFLVYFEKLLKDKNEIKKNVEDSKNCIISPETFNSNLYNNILTKKCLDKTVCSHIHYNETEVEDLYLELENNFLKDHYNRIWIEIKMRIFKDNPILGVKIVYYKLMQLLHNRYNLKRYL